jgi:hypothetical protein
MAAIFSPYATPKVFVDVLKTVKTKGRNAKNTMASIANHRQNIFESSLQEAAKALFLAKPQLKVLQASSIDASWLGEAHRDKVKSQLAIAFNELIRFAKDHGIEVSGKDRKRLRSAQTLLIETMTVVCDALTVEGGGRDRDATASTDVGLTGFARSNQRGSVAQQPNLSSSWRHVCAKSRKFEQTIGSQYRQLTNDANLYQALGKTTNERDVINLKALWRAKYAGDCDKLSSMIWLLGETSYLFLRRAKLLYHATGNISFDTWVRSARASNLGLELCRHLPLSHLDFQLQSLVKLHSLYGIALANLGRFFEANRHLNEAQALLSKSPGATGADFAIVSLRRAEARLTECYWIRLFLAEHDADACSALTLHAHGKLTGGKLSLHFGADTVVRLINGDTLHEGWAEASIGAALPEPNSAGNIVFVPPKISECFRKSLVPRLKSGMLTLTPDHSGEDRWKHTLRNNLLRLYAGTLDEAWALLEQASSGLCGNSQSSLWWCRYHTLKIRAFAALEPLGIAASDSLAFRKESPDLGMHDAFTSVIRISGSDRFRQFRAVKYFFDANHWLAVYSHHSMPNVGRSGSNIKPQDALMPDTFRLAVETLCELLRDVAGRTSARTIGDNGSSAETFPLESAIRQLYFSLDNRDILASVLRHPSFLSTQPSLMNRDWLKDNWGRSIGP